jgi:hypothetical protein
MGATVHQLPARATGAQLVTKTQLARQLGRSERWVELRAQEGMPRAGLDRGGRRLFDTGVCEKWLAARLSVRSRSPARGFAGLSRSQNREFTRRKPLQMRVTPDGSRALPTQNRRTKLNLRRSRSRRWCAVTHGTGWCRSSHATRQPDATTQNRDAVGVPHTHVKFQRGGQVTARLCSVDSSGSLRIWRMAGARCCLPRPRRHRRDQLPSIRRPPATSRPRFARQPCRSHPGGGPAHTPLQDRDTRPDRTMRLVVTATRHA